MISFVNIICTKLTALQAQTLQQQYSSSSGPSTKRNQSYSLRRLDGPRHDNVTPTQPDYSSLGPHYDMIITQNKGLDTYDVIDHNQQKTNTPQAKPANPTPVRDEASKKGDDFYEAEEHTYSVVNVEHKKKDLRQSQQLVRGEWEGPPVNDMAMPA